MNVDVAVLDSGIDVDHPDLDVAGGVNCMTGSNIICGIEFATATRTDGDPNNDIRVANMSLTAPGADDGNCGLTKTDPMHLAICNSVDARVAYAVGAANDAADFEDRVPASYDEVLTATAAADVDGQPGGLVSAHVECSIYDPAQADDSAATFSDFATLAADQAHRCRSGVCVDSAYRFETFPHTYSSGTSILAARRWNGRAVHLLRCLCGPDAEAGRGEDRGRCSGL